MSLDLEKIKKELQTLPDMTNISQIGLQGTKDNLDPFLSVGTINKIEKYKETDFVVPIFDIPYINSIMAELKKRQCNEDIRPREYLTLDEVKDLIKGAKASPWYGSRDATLILLMFRKDLDNLLFLR